MHAQRKLVSFIGLGSASAAPLLYSYIKMHPEVCLPEKETEFFSSTKAYRRGINWYESLFTKNATDFTCGELANNYLPNVQTPSLIARTYPSAKLLAVVENPLVSVRVAYVEARRARTVSPRISLEMFLKQNPDVLLGARYGRQLSHYFSYYSLNDLLVVVASDVRENTLEVIAQVYEHIGVDVSYVPLSLKHLIPEEEGDPKKRPGLIKRFFRAIKKLVINFFHALYKKIHPPEVLIETASIVARKIPLSPELETYLKDYYRHDVALLSTLMHRSLSSEWGMDLEIEDKEPE